MYWSGLVLSLIILINYHLYLFVWLFAWVLFLSSGAAKVTSKTVRFWLKTSNSTFKKGIIKRLMQFLFALVWFKCDFIQVYKFITRVNENTTIQWKLEWIRLITQIISILKTDYLYRSSESQMKRKKMIR